MQTYSLRDLRSMLGLSRAVVSGLIAAGFVTPGRGARREYRFSFQDMVLLRTAHQLRAAQIPPRRIVSALRRLHAQLPESMPLSAARIAAIGNEVVLREAGQRWTNDAGQSLLDFDAAAQPTATLSAITRPLPAAGAAEWFARGCALEAHDRAAAMQAYRRALQAEPDFADAYLNLGVMLGDAGRAAEAIGLYRQAVERLGQHALLRFNLAVMLEDSGHIEQALAEYGRCLAIDPGLADAHFNAARLHDRLGHAKQAIRHYSAYKRLNK